MSPCSILGLSVPTPSAPPRGKTANLVGKFWNNGLSLPGKEIAECGWKVRIRMSSHFSTF